MTDSTPATAAAARRDWLEGYEFALRNINDEAVQADLAKIVEFGVTTSLREARCSPADLPTGSAPAPGRDKRGHIIDTIGKLAAAVYERDRDVLSEESVRDLRNIAMGAHNAAEGGT